VAVATRHDDGEKENLVHGEPIDLATRMACVPTPTVMADHPLFENLPANERALVGEHFQVERRQQGERFTSDTSSLVVVVSGRLRVFIEGPDERELTLALLDAGDAFGAAPIDGARARYIEALDQVALITCSATDLSRLVELAPTFGIRVLRVLLENARGVGDDLARLAFCAVPQRLAAKLLELMDRYGRVTPSGIRIDVRFTHLQLSHMIGTSRETLTKALGELRASGAVDIRDRLIWVLDPGALEAASSIG
jgi:CRP/FNR family cyclic AMP-dependent transcriptional regulator